LPWTPCTDCSLIHKGRSFQAWFYPAFFWQCYDLNNGSPQHKRSTVIWRYRYHMPRSNQKQTRKTGEVSKLARSREVAHQGRV
jgi:hypothetical protein